MKTRVFFTFVILLMFILSFVFLGQVGATLNTTASIASTQNSNMAYLASLNTGDHYAVVLVVATLLLLSALWVRPAWRYLRHGTPLLLVMLILAACGGTNSAVTVEPNEIAFVVPVIGDSAYQGEVNGDPTYWLKHEQPNVHEVTVTQSWFSQNFLSGYWRDDVRVIKVKVTAVSHKYNTPVLDPTTCAVTDKGNGFAVEDIDSHGIDMGAVLTAHIDAKDAPTFLAHYGERQLEDDPNNPSDVPILDSEVKNYIQSQLFIEVGKRSLNDVRAQKEAIFSTIFTNTAAWFKDKGITIDTIGGTDGLVYENCDIQKEIDASFGRQEQQVQIQQQSTNQAVLNRSLVDQSYAQATATHIASVSDAESIKLRGEALAQNQQLVQQDAVSKWDGHLPQVMDSNSSLPFVGAALNTPPAPEATEQVK